MKPTVVPLLLPLLLFPRSELHGQASGSPWTLAVSGGISAFGLDLRTEPAWRKALGGKLRMTWGDHFYFEAGATSSTSSTDALACAMDDPGPCVVEHDRREFTLWTAAMGLLARLGRVTPFLGAGGGRIEVDARSRTTWLLNPGVRFRLMEALHLFGEYRASRVRWPAEGVGLNRSLKKGGEPRYTRHGVSCQAALRAERPERSTPRPEDPRDR